jgi:drug/metabolite transporter (DMT)-like permease
MTLSDTFKGEALALAALLIFSSNIVLTKVASARLALNAGYLVAIVMNIAFSALLFALELGWRTHDLRWDWTGVLIYAAAGVFSTYLGRWFFFEAIARLGPAKASIFQVSSPIFTVVIAWIALGQALDALAIAAIAVAMIGLMLVSVSPHELARMASGRAAASVEGKAVSPLRALVRSGLAVGLGSSAAYAVGNVLRGAGIQRWNEPILGALLGAVAGLAFHLVLTPGNAEALRVVRVGDRRGVLLFALSGTLTISAQMCVIAGMGYIPVAVVAMVTLCTPLLVFPMSYWVLRNQEGITRRTLLGGGVTLAGIVLLILR